MKNYEQKPNRLRPQRDAFDDEERSLDEETMRAEKLKNLLHKKIDACFTKYGTYGLSIIDESISDGLSSMINGGTRRQAVAAPAQPQRRPMQQQQPMRRASGMAQPQRRRPDPSEDSSLADVAAILEGLPEEDDTRLMVTDKGVVDLNKHPEADMGVMNEEEVLDFPPQPARPIRQESYGKDPNVFDMDSLPDAGIDVKDEQSLGIDDATAALLNGEA